MYFMPSCVTGSPERISDAMISMYAPVRIFLSLCLCLVGGPLLGAHIWHCWYRSWTSWFIWGQ